MRMRNLVSVAISLLIVSGSSYGDPTSDAKAKGTQIGTVISSAISTALPGISTLATAVLNIFKPKDATAPDKQAQVQQATADTSAAIEQAIKAQLVPVQSLATQLDTLGPFLQYGFRASADLSTLMAFLAGNPKPTPDQWRGKIKPTWASIKAALDAIPITSAMVQSDVPATDLQELLLQILEAKAVTSAAIQSLVSTSTSDGLADALGKLNSTLSTLNVVARVQLNSLSQEVHTLTKWALTPPTTKPPKAQGVKGLPKEIQLDKDAATKILLGARN
jgi:hypothetical protein